MPETVLAIIITIICYIVLLRFNVRETENTNVCCAIWHEERLR